MFFNKKIIIDYTFSSGLRIWHASDIITLKNLISTVYTWEKT